MQSKSRYDKRPEPILEAGMRSLAIAAGDVALYCDRAEHAEQAPVELIADSAERLRTLSVELCEALGLDLPTLYAERIAAVELRNPTRDAAGYDGGRAALAARSWRQLQVVQVRHDRAYHPDVISMGKGGEVRHCALHVAKLAGWYARGLRSEDCLREIADQRVADTLIFGLKLTTLAGIRLDETALPRVEAAPARSAIPRLSRSSGL